MTLLPSHSVQIETIYSSLCKSSVNPLSYLSFSFSFFSFCARLSFNPVAHTALVKTLQRIASLECSNTVGGGGGGGARNTRGPRNGVKYHLPSREVIEQLAESSVGDIRSAVNALQFTCLAGVCVCVCVLCVVWCVCVVCVCVCGVRVCACVWCGVWCVCVCVVCGVVLCVCVCVWCVCVCVCMCIHMMYMTLYVRVYMFMHLTQEVMSSLMLCDM